MKASNLSRLLVGAALAVFALLPLTTAEAQTSSEALYTITLTAITAANEPDVAAAQIAAAAGGTIEAMTEGTVTMRLSPSRSRVVAADPRVQSIAPRTDAGSPRNVAAEAERMTWSTGVAYDYDGSGNVRQIGTDTFVYDTVGRLVQSQTNGTRRNYEYDAFGNRTKCRESAGTPNEGDCQNGYTIDPANNRLQNTTHDAAGNVTGLGAHTYSYDALNMQTRAAWGSLAREYIYTADDERIAVYEVGQRWRWTVRDTSGKVLREFTSTGALGTTNWQWTKDYVWRDGLLLASRQKEGSTVTTYHYHLDHLGTPRRITDATDRIVGIHDYFPFGTEQSGAQNEPSLSLMKFTGHERDIVGSESWNTLDYMHARYDSPSMGRFLSVDPVGGTADRPQSWNRYGYVENNPIGAIDPTGMSMKCVTKADGNDDCTVIPDDPNPDPFPHPHPLPDWIVNIQAALTPGSDAADMKRRYADEYWRNVWNPEPIQFYNGDVTLGGVGSAGRALGTSRINLLQNTTNARLRNLINQLFRPNARVGTGSTGDALRYEMQNGLKLSKVGHHIKALEMRTALTRVLREESLSAVDKQAVRAILIDLQKALSGL